MKRTFLNLCKLALLMIAAGDCLRTARASGPLAWDTNDFLYVAKPGDVTGHLNLHVTNLAVYEVIIKGVKPSCGCTVAKMPATPWRIKPGATDHLELLIDLRGKRGELYKQLTIDSSDAPDVLNFTVRIPDPGTNELSEDAQMRIWGQELGATDHQAVFKQNCVKCHLKPAFGKSGEVLFHSVCGICHESPRRATMVPDLKKTKGEHNEEYWRHWVTYGKEGSLMPGFAATLGGPLDVPQIDSLVHYLTYVYPFQTNAYDVPKIKK